MKKNLLKIIILFFIIDIIMSLFISQNNIHLEKCSNECCSYCMIISIAQNIIKIVVNYIIAIIIGILIYLFLSRLRKKYIIYIKTSLVLQKIQLNE